jgi:hypothetical protein
MFRKSFILFSLIVIVASGCIKETYNLKKLSGKAQLSPTVGVSAAYGNISLSDILKASDTVVFGSDKFIKLVFKKDSVVNYKLADYYDLSNMVSYTDSYQIGELSMSPFSGTVNPVTPTGELPFPAFTNFESATLSQGALDITVNNNTGVVINTITITIYNFSPHQQLGIPATISGINPGQTGTATINLANLTFIRNSTSVAFVISAGSGLVLTGTNLPLTMTGRDMKVKSGKIVVPPQSLSTFQSHDTIPFDPGTGVEISYIKMTSGNISYTLNSNTQLSGTVSLTLPSTLRSGIPVSESLTAVPNKVTTGSISVNSSTIDLGTKLSHPYNLLPIVSTVTVGSGGSMVTFNSTDVVKLDLSFLNPVFDYVKGYFGQKTESINKDTLDLDIKDILDHITGSFLVASPSIRLNYANSFAIPVQITLDAAGYRKSNVVQLGLTPVTLGYPAAPAERIKRDVFTINKSNSQLPQLISMPPERVIFSGSAKMNPQVNTGARDNYLFNDSYFLGNLEIEVPLEFRLNNLQFADTVNNFMKDQNTGNNPIKPEDFEFLRVDITADNGFPLGVSLNMILYDSASHSNKCTIDATDVLKAATVDANGKVTAPVSSATSITISQDFWKYINTADKIIFRFSMNTTNSSSQDVKIYSDYNINFKAALVLKPLLKFKLN